MPVYLSFLVTAALMGLVVVGFARARRNENWERLALEKAGHGCFFRMAARISRTLSCTDCRAGRLGLAMALFKDSRQCNLRLINSL